MKIIIITCKSNRIDNYWQYRLDIIYLGVHSLLKVLLTFLNLCELKYTIAHYFIIISFLSFLADFKEGGGNQFDCIFLFATSELLIVWTDLDYNFLFESWYFPSGPRGKHQLSFQFGPALEVFIVKMCIILIKFLVP